MCSHIEQRFYFSRNKNFKFQIKIKTNWKEKFDFLRQLKDNKYMRKKFAKNNNLAHKIVFKLHC